MGRVPCACLLIASLLMAPTAAAQVEVVDKVVVRWTARGAGGTARPQFITARELAFEARLEALSDGLDPQSAYADKHVRGAIQRHITESMLAQLPVDPRPTPKQVAEYAEGARLILEQQVGGREQLAAAAEAEGIVSDELNAILRRRARASWYLDRMVAPMLRPSELDLREVHRRGESPYSNQKFENVEDQLRRWYVASRMNAALDRYFRNVRSRVKIVLISR
jgi:hypothetical protein